MPTERVPNESRRATDTDSAEAALKLRTAVLSGWGAILGAVAGFPIALKYGGGWVTVAASCVVGFGTVYLTTRVIGERAARVASHIFAPSGKSTSSRPEYSYAASLVARGRLEEAVRAYEESCGENPHDPEPRIRLARLLRDRLGRYEEAILCSHTHAT